MKKYAFVLGLLLCTTTTLFAQDEQKSSNFEGNHVGIHPWKAPDYTGKQGSWSISIEAGGNMFSGSISQRFKDLFTNWIPTLGIGVEYSINPVWGVALQYDYAPYYAKWYLNEDVELTGRMHSVELLATIDLMDLWFPKRPKNIFSLYLLAGGGLGWFNCELSNPNNYLTGNDGSSSYLDTDVAGPKRNTDKGDMTGLIPLGMMAEFNLNRNFAVGAKVMFHIYMQDNLDSWAAASPTRASTMNDFMEYVTINFRWKINSRKTDHKRNWRDPEPEYTPYDNYIAPKRDTVVVIYKPQPDTIYVAMQQPATSAATSASPYASTSTHAPAATTTCPCKGKSATPRTIATFNAGNNSLNDNALVAIYELAVQMQADTTLYLELRGYCDNTGSDEYNQQLSRKRAEMVKNELVKVYNISPDRIIANGYGKIAHPAKNYTPNRRVEYRFIDAAEAEQLKEEQQAAANNDLSFAEPRTYTQKTTETIRPDATLSTYAQEHYGDARFWVYIYEANQDKIQDPDKIISGTEIVIPELPQELIDATNPECLAYAQQLKERYAQK